MERHNHKTAERHTSKVPLKIVENSHEIQGKQQMEEEQEELSHIQGKKSFYPRPAANNFAPSSGVYNSQKRNNNSGIFLLLIFLMISSYLKPKPKIN